MYAYCNNNPVVREDNQGCFWHIVVGAVVGAVVNGAAKVTSNLIEGKPVTDGLATAMVAGAASGALASSGVGIVGAVAGNMAISMTENAVNQVVENDGFKDFNVESMLVDGAIGGIAGAIGGPGEGNKHMMNLGKQTVKRTVNATTHHGLIAGAKEAGSAFAYYGKNTIQYYNRVFRHVPADFAVSVGTNFASS